MYSLTQFEIPTSTPIQAMAFYNHVFGWIFYQKNQHTYLSVKESEEGTAISPTIQADANPTVSTIEVKDVDRVVQKIQQQGGEIVVPKMAVPGIGWLAYFKGPDEHVFSLMQPDIAAA